MPRQPKKKQNVEMGFYAGGRFHPIRASADYDSARADEGRDAHSHYLTQIKRTHERKLKEKAMATKTKNGKSSKTATTATTKKTTAAKKTAAKQNGLLTDRMLKAAVEHAAEKLTNRINRKRAKARAKNPADFIHLPTAKEIKPFVQSKLEQNPHVVSFVAKNPKGYTIRTQGFRTKSEANAAAKEAKEKGHLSPKVHSRSQRRRNTFEPDATHNVKVRQHYRQGKESFHQRVTKAGQQFLFKMNGKRNPSETELARLHEEFLGTPVNALEYVAASDDMPNVLTTFGDSVNLLELDNGVDVFEFHFSGDALPDAATDGKKIYLIKTNDDDRRQLQAIAGHNATVNRIEYNAVKMHLDGVPVDYYHFFGEETGDKPHLTFAADGTPIIKGGAFWFAPEGIRN